MAAGRCASRLARASTSARISPSDPARGLTPASQGAGCPLGRAVRRADAGVLTAMKRLVLPCGFADGTTQASTVFDFPAAGQADPSCPQDGVAAGQDLEPILELETRDGSVGFACTGVGKGDWN